MADKKLNEVTKVTDMAYVPVIMADGSIGQIAKADLATVVAGLMGTKSLFPFAGRGGVTSTDLNDIITPGVYELSSGFSNGPGFGWCPLIVFKSRYLTQIAISSEATIFAFRVNLGESWTAWKTLT